LIAVNGGSGFVLPKDEGHALTVAAALALPGLNANEPANARLVRTYEAVFFSFLTSKTSRPW